MQFSVAWQRPVSRSWVASVAYQSLYLAVGIVYWPNLTWASSPLITDLIPADVGERPTGAVLPDSPAAILVGGRPGRVDTDEIEALAPFRIGILPYQPAKADLQRSRPVHQPAITHADRSPRDFFRVFIEALHPALLQRGTLGLIEDLVTHARTSQPRWTGSELVGATANKLPRQGVTAEAMAWAMVLIADANFRLDELTIATQTDTLGHLLEPDVVAQRVAQMASLLESLYGLERLAIKDSATLPEILEAWQILAEATIQDQVLGDQTTQEMATELVDVAAEPMSSEKAAILQELIQLCREVVFGGGILIAQQGSRVDRLPGHIFEDQPTSTAGQPDPWEDIWKIYQAGQDDIIVPGRDYNYAQKFGEVFDPSTGRVLEALSDPHLPDVIVRVPAGDPFAIGGERRRRVISLTILRQLFAVLDFFRADTLSQMDSWSVEQVLQEGLAFIFAAIQSRVAGLSMEPFYMRAFRLLRWYAERALYEHGRYTLSRQFTPWIAPLAAGYLDKAWQGQGVSFTGGAIVLTGDSFIRIPSDIQIHGDVLLELIIPADATATLIRSSGDVLLASGLQSVPVLADDPIEIRVNAPGMPVEVRRLEREGQWLQEYTIMPEISPGTALVAFDYWRSLLAEYYLRHHTNKTKGTRLFHSVN